MGSPLNIELMRHPANWIIVTLMAVLGSLAVKFIIDAARIGDAQA